MFDNDSFSSSQLHHEMVQEEVEQYNPEVKLGEVIGGRLALQSVIGTGTYGAVYLASDVVTGLETAVKVLWKGGLEEDQLALQRMEIDINKRLAGPKGTTHPNIIAMRNHYEDDECLYLELELHKGGDLYDAIQKLGGLDDILAKYVFDQILAAVEYCHSRGVYHRDLKPENILVTDDWQCKLCDFGLASLDEYTSEMGCGSAPYMSPESRGGLHTKVDGYLCKQSDIWSLGVVLLNILFGCNPWQVADESDSAFGSYLEEPDKLRTQFALSTDCFSLLKTCFALDPFHRPELERVRTHISVITTFVDPSILDEEIILSSSPSDHVKRVAILKHAEGNLLSRSHQSKQRASRASPAFSFKNTGSKCNSSAAIPCLQRLKLIEKTSSGLKACSNRTIEAC